MFYKRRLKSRRQERFEIPLLPETVFVDVINTLKVLFGGKCAYCEAPFTGSRDGLDRFRPMHGAIGLQSDYWPDHYWWLADEWNNIYACCEICNKIKGPKFPVIGDRPPVEASWGQLAKEQRLLIDPCADHPAEDLEFLANGMVRPRTNKGDVTIGVLELNRAPLVKARKELAKRIQRRTTALKWLKTLPPNALASLGKPGFAADALRAIQKTHRSHGKHGSALSDLQHAVASTHRTPRLLASSSPRGCRA